MEKVLSIRIIFVNKNIHIFDFIRYNTHIYSPSSAGT